MRNEIFLAGTFATKVTTAPTAMTAT